MSSGIGSFNFLRMSGPDVPKLAAAVEMIDRPGVDGVASRIDAFKAEELTVYTTEGVTNISTANSRIDSYASLKGTLITVVDDCGRSIDSVLVVDVRVQRKQNVLTSSDPGIGALVFAVWLLKPTLK